MIYTLEPAAAQREIARIVRDELLLGSEREIPFDQPLGELGLGLDSLALVNLLTAVEAAFGVELSDDIWTQRGPLSVDDLAEIVRGTTPAAAPIPSAQADSAVPHGRMERLEQRLQGRGSAGRAAWAAIRIAAPIRRFLFVRTQHVLLERRLDDETLTDLAPPPGIEFRLLPPGVRPDLADLWAPVHARHMTNVFRREVGRGAIALVACSGDRVVAVDLLSGSGGLDVDVASPEACFGFFLEEAPVARGRGIGLALAAHSFRVARERGFRTQFIHVWKRNTAMLAAATQLLGFGIVGSARRTQVLGVSRWSWEIGGKRGRGPRLVL
jgi:acyl carrier protein/GNAT superfamily N-acetyltransferase